MQPLIRYEDFWNSPSDSSEVEIYSVLTMSRNLASFPFQGRMETKEQNELFSICDNQISTVASGRSFEYPALEHRSLFAEQSLFPGEETLFRKVLTTGQASGIAAGGKSHLVLSHAFSDGKFYSAFNEIDTLDDRIGEKVEYAFSGKFGYLFENPADCGTGFSAKALLHLPALSISNAREEVRTLCSEFDTQIVPFRKESLPLYILTANNRFGDSEQDLCANIQGAISSLDRMEREARETHKSQRLAQLEDLIWRSYGLLCNCRMISWEEEAEYLLNLRLGLILSVFPHFDFKTINTLIFETSDPFLSCYSDDQGTDDTILRADLIRRAMNTR